MKKGILQTILTVSVILGVIILGYFVYRTPEDVTKIAEERINQSIELQELDKLCKEIPIPNKMRFTGKFVGKPRSFVTHYYESSTLQGILFANDFFNVKGWKVSEKNSSKDSISFEKPSNFVTIKYQENVLKELYFYEITCS